MMHLLPLNYFWDPTATMGWLGAKDESARRPSSDAAAPPRTFQPLEHEPFKLMVIKVQPTQFSVTISKMKQNQVFNLKISHSRVYEFVFILSDVSENPPDREKLPLRSKWPPGLSDSEINSCLSWIEGTQSSCHLTYTHTLHYRCRTGH